MSIEVGRACMWRWRRQRVEIAYLCAVGATAIAYSRGRVGGPRPFRGQEGLSRAALVVILLVGSG